MIQQESTRSVPPRTSAVRVAGGVVLAAAGAVAVNAIIAALAHAAGADDQFKPLTIGAFGPLSVVGVFAGALGWALVRRLARRPAAVLRRLVPVVVVLSFIPDTLLLVGDGQAGTSTLGVVALMLMHVAVATVAVPVFRRVLPVAARD